LRDIGYVEGVNIVIDYRWAEGQYDRLPALAAELVHANVDVIVTHGTPGSLAAKRATTLVPIVMAIVGDPVVTGIVASVARPGGNITGQSFFSPELRGKRIELLKEVMPGIAQVAVLFNPRSAASEPELRALEVVARSLDVGVQGFPLQGLSELGAVLESIKQMRIEAVEVGDDGLVIANLAALAELATKRRLVLIGPKETAQVGGLIGYGVESFAAFRHAAVFVDKIVKGAKPADLPIEQATKFEFILNLKAAKSFGVTVPTATLLRADEVIE
jgi:putative ABC transport system substrate-binding protein